MEHLILKVKLLDQKCNKVLVVYLSITNLWVTLGKPFNLLIWFDSHMYDTPDFQVQPNGY